MEEEDKCENCWWHFGINGGSCHHPSRADKIGDQEEACGWFEPKLKPVEHDKYEEYQNEWN